MLDKHFWKGKKVFLTGHTGFKGSWLSSLLLDAGADVTGYSLAPCTKDSLFELLNLSRHINSVTGDIRDLDALKKVFLSSSPEIIFHLAAQPIVTESYKSPVYTYETNVMGTVNILECARIYGTARSIVNVTTDKVYLNKEWHWGYRENDRLCGHDPYSNSKSCSELVTRSYIDSFFYADEAAAISTARSGNVIGGGDFSPGRIIPDCVRAAHKQRTIAVRNPNSTRPYQHVLECLHGYMLLAQKQYEDKNKYAGSYNFGPNDTCCITTGELVGMFCRKWGAGQTWESTGIDGPHEASLLKLDCSKAKAALGWKPVWTIHDAVDKTVEWYRSWHQKQDMAELTSLQIYSFLNNV
ncbi:CDP-glucose 4,6-dehydratase [Anaerobacterium chartisolvens]|uniref:CDP-glucose 4,6-dehydratase n=1 Tax=Anaerobacterium chartisolvens TaxID=1297424 RepID=A0A369B5W1_9FIRM|nr:CDP-glucose 4,6-dehydratase [Anaerobacterium chartisolvens]RCX16883.1 CDP-glucose 4,6-dehydratase [Anaerobacterium chartisolvens]